MPNMKNGTILDTEKNKIDLGDSPIQAEANRNQACQWATEIF